MLDKQSKHDVVLNAVELIKSSEFGATAIKVELEANLYRDYDSDWERDVDCHDWLMASLESLGLAEHREQEIGLSHGGWTQYHPIGALAYAEFYNDGSVDSEFTFTIKLDDPNNIFLLPKITAIWNDFMEEVSNGTGKEPELYGAGMHMALLNSADSSYPTRRVLESNVNRYDNFKRSMMLLLPSLFFLASSDKTSRPLEYRMPRITIHDGATSWEDRRRGKFSAICYNQGALEFRVFNVCYQQPDILLDNFVVMANATRKYWRKNYHNPGLSKICRRTNFGNDLDDSLERFYFTVQHVDLLNEGLKRLKPSYYSIKQLKAQRSFRVSKRTITGALKRVKRDAAKRYQEYEARFHWQQKIERLSYIRAYLDNYTHDHDITRLKLEDEAKVMLAAEGEADIHMQANVERKKDLNNFIEEAVIQFKERQRGSYRLEAE